MKFIHYLENGNRHIGLIKDKKIYRTIYKELSELFDKDLSKLDLVIEENEIKELPIIEYPRQDILCA